MLKGTNSNVFLNITEFSHSNIDRTIVSDKDTISIEAAAPSDIHFDISKPSHSVIQGNQQRLHPVIEKNVDSIFAASEHRETTIRSEHKIQVLQVNVIPMNKDTGVLYLFRDYPTIGQFSSQAIGSEHPNIYVLIAGKNITNHFYSTELTRIDTTNKLTNNQIIAKELVIKNTGFEGKIKQESALSWLPGILLFSLFTFSFIKIIYRKYVLQVLYSLINYQASVRLLRDRNVLFRNMAVGLNLVFGINAGLFVYFMLDYFKIGQIQSNSFISFLIYALCIIVLFNLKFILCKTLGFLFLVHEIFEEYIHNENLSNKIIGLLLFPIIILIPYIPLSIKAIVLYTGMVMLVILFVLRIIRGIQIIIRKEVSPFYLILYLCTIEILPLLIMVKFSYKMI